MVTRSLQTMRPFHEGSVSRAYGSTLTDNPYTPDRTEHRAWAVGWKEVDHALKQLAKSTQDTHRRRAAKLHDVHSGLAAA